MAIDRFRQRIRNLTRIQTVFWQGVILILRLRGRLALRNCARSAAALLGLAFVLLVGGPASFAAAQICHARLAAATPAAAPGVLASILLGVQAIFLVALIPRLGIAIGKSLPAALVRPLPVRPIQIVVAGALGAILDAPILFALPVFVVVIVWAGSHWAIAGALAATLTLLFLTLQTVALSQALEQGARWIAASRRGGIVIALAPILLLGSLAVSPGGVMKAPDRASANKPPQTQGAPAWAVLALPGGVAAQATVAAQQRDWGRAAANILLLAAFVPATVWAAARLYGAAEAIESASVVLPTRRKARPLSPAFSSPALSLAAAVFGLEWRCLLRDPASYLPLRGPAMLLLTLFLGWIAPNAGDDPIVTLRDLVCMAGLFYIVLCQIQLLCNRFGNEPGTAGFMLSFPAQRRFLFVGKNAALLCLLLPLDAAIVAALCAIAHAPLRLAGTIIEISATVVIVLTCIGNIISVAVPFPIAKRGERFQTEPDRSLIFIYCFLAALAGGACWAFAVLRDRTSGPIAGIAATAALVALYAGSLLVSERLLTRRELEVIQSLEGNS